MNRGTSLSMVSSTNLRSYWAMSPEVSMPKSFPSSLAMGSDAEGKSLSLMSSQARWTVTASERMGGLSKFRSFTWVRTSWRRMGDSNPNRCKMRLVSSLSTPRRQATYCLSPRAWRKLA